MEDRGSRRKLEILTAVIQALELVDYSKLTIEDIAARAGVGKSTIYRWWKHKSELVFDAFKLQTASVFDFSFDQSLKFNLNQQLFRLSQSLNLGIGRALLVVITQHRDAAGRFFQQYLLPRREQTYKLIEIAIRRKEIIENYPFDFMLDTLYAPIHYQIIFFNQTPNEAYIENLVNFILEPVLLKNNPEI